MTTTSRSPSATNVSRRSFLEGSVALAAATAIPGGAFAAGSDRIKIGVVGCGGRGVGAALQAVAADASVVIAALGDRFADQLDAAAATLAASGDGRFASGLFHGERAAEFVIESDVDAVILATPPCYRPAEIAAAVRAGRHVYAEAPVGIDAAGVRCAAAGVEDGRRRGLSLASGLQSRHHSPTRSTVAAIAAGGIGQPLRAVAIHHIGLPWVRPHQAGWSAEDAAVRNWIGDERFSGGVFLDHLVHAVDRCSWALGEPTRHPRDRRHPPRRHRGSRGRNPLRSPRQRRSPAVHDPGPSLRRRSGRRGWPRHLHGVVHQVAEGRPPPRRPRDRLPKHHAGSDGTVCSGGRGTGGLAGSLAAVFGPTALTTGTIVIGVNRRPLPSR